MLEPSMVMFTSIPAPLPKVPSLRTSSFAIWLVPGKDVYWTVHTNAIHRSFLAVEWLDKAHRVVVYSIGHPQALSSATTVALCKMSNDWGATSAVAHWAQSCIDRVTWYTTKAIWVELDFMFSGLYT